MRIQTIYLALIVLVIHGCGEDSGLGTTDPRLMTVRDASIVVPPDCVADVECPRGQVCLLGQCQMEMMGAQCADDQGCSAGQACVDGQCVIAGEQCGDGMACSAGQVCQGGQCVEQEMDCTGPDECAANEACIEGICRSTGCQADSDCGPTASCVDGACVPINPECMADGDCAVGESCQLGVCTPAGGCMGDGECPGTQVCVDGSCQPSNAGCQNDAECGPNADCVNGQCIGNDPCADCPPNTRCVNDVCVPDNEACIIDSDCPAGMLCSAGVCMADGEQMCIIDTDCPLGTECLNGACEMIAGIGDQCAGDADCHPRLSCVANICLPVDDMNPCVVDGDCNAGERCDAGVCVARVGALGDPCMVVGDCANGLLCVAGMCSEDMGGNRCEGDNECPAGQICFNGGCVDRPGQMCMGDLDCNGDRCVNGVCVLACLVNADCLFDQVCLNGGCSDPGNMMQPNTCDMPIPIALGGTVRGTTVGAASVNGASCGSDAEGPEVAHRFVAAADGLICATTNNSDFDTVLYVRQDDCENGLELVCNDDDNIHDIAVGTNSTVQVPVNGGESYFFFVDGYDAGDSGDYALELRDGRCDGVEVIQCVADRAINLGDALIGEIAGASRAEGSCGGDGGGELIYEFSVAEDAQVCVSTADSEIDTVLYVRQARCGDGVEVDCNDDGGLAQTSKFSFQAMANTEYFIFVDAYDEAGAVRIAVSPGACL